MLEFKLPDMTCGHCVGAVTQALKQVDPEAEVVVDLPQRKVRVASATPATTLADALAEAGYPPA